MEYKYGMRLRGFSPMCQPKGVIRREDDPTGKYYDVIIYDRQLSEREISNYDLDSLDNLDSLASRLNDFMKDYDPYEYADCGGSLEEVKKTLSESPETVIDMLLNIIENMEKEINQ